MKREMNQCVLLEDLRLQLSNFYSGNIILCHQTSVPRFKHKKKHFLFRIVHRQHLGHTVPFHEKRYQGRVFCGYWLSYILLLWLVEIILSDEFPAPSHKHCFHFRKLNIMPKSAVVVKRNMSLCVSQASFRLKLSRFLWGKILLWPLSPNIVIHKKYGSLQFQSCV